MGLFRREKFSDAVRFVDNVYTALREKDVNPRPFAAGLRYLQVAGEIVSAQELKVQGVAQYVCTLRSDQLIDPLESVRNPDNHEHYQIAGNLELRLRDRISADVTRTTVKTSDPDVMVHLVKWYELVQRR